MLPLELRLAILELVAEDYRFDYRPYARARYASVCRQWQPVFERRNFRRLILDQSRVLELQKFVRSRHRRDYVEHLFLRVRLGQYACHACHKAEDDETARKYVASLLSHAHLLL
jgi:hypothetical protein